MKIAAVQLRSYAGEIAANVAKHLAFIQVAIDRGADLIFFPELSLTGYEPQLAKSLAVKVTDPRLEVFQQCSDDHSLIVGVGLPISVGSNVQIAMVWFAPNTSRRSYAKQQLHRDELPFFVAGKGQLMLETLAHRLAPAICYESLQPSHADNAARLGAEIYLASVAKSAGGVAQAMRHYPAIARQHCMSVIMSNALGPSDTFVSAGRSAAWGNQGELLTQMDGGSEGLLMLDTASGIASGHNL